MEPAWINNCTIRAHLDKIRFTIEPKGAVTREMVAANLPRLELQGRPREHIDAPRWELLHADREHNVFEVTVHDPSCIPAVVAVIDRMTLRLPLLRGPQIVLMELALDVWPKRPGGVDLERIAADMFKGAKFEPSSNTRAADKDGAVGLTGPDAAYRNLKAGRTLYNGSVGDDAMIRCYVKRTDNKRALPEDEHRARFEVELAGNGRPVANVRDLVGYRFELLSHMFLMSRPADGLPPVMRILANQTPKLRRAPRRARHARVLMDRAFLPFNKKAYAALQGLTSSMANARRCPYRPDHMDALMRGSVIADRFFLQDQCVSPKADSPFGGVLLTKKPIPNSNGQNEDREAA